MIVLQESGHKESGVYKRFWRCSDDIRCSMSRKRNCWDNAVAESFFYTLKVELIHGKAYGIRQEVNTAILNYIEIFCNPISAQ
jgi:transposase InsO family protein